MKVFEYTGESSQEPGKKEKHRAADIESIIDDMQRSESFEGAYSSEKIASLWFALKRELFNAIIQPIDKGDEKSG